MVKLAKKRLNKHFENLIRDFYARNLKIDASMRHNEAFKLIGFLLHSLT